MNRHSLGIICCFVIIAMASSAPAQTIDVALVHDDAIVVKRVVELSKRDVPRDLLEKIATEDIETLRGRREDGTYLWAHYVREEAGRKSDGFTAGQGEDLTALRFKGELVYALEIEVPTRRYVVRRNQRTWIDRVEMDVIPIQGSSRFETLPVGQWIEPGSKTTIQLPEIARTARVTVYARTDEDAGAASVQLTFLEPRIADDPTSPYSRAVGNLKLLLRTLRSGGDASNLVTVANLLLVDPILARPILPLAPVTTRQQPALRPPVSEAESFAPRELYEQLQTIEDLLTGSDREKRDGLDQLHQLLRRLRPDS